MRLFSDFLERDGILLDVRSPKEFLHAHIPGAFSWPLFTDDERSQVGRLYKQVGKYEAMAFGLELTASKIDELLDLGLKLTGYTVNCRIYCWRGGLRSGSMSKLLSTLGKTPTTLKGGYKNFRRGCLDFLQKTPLPQLNVLGGMTGSGKTEVLSVLEKLGESVIDLESLASHTGSSFGSYFNQDQISQEMFENRLFMALSKSKDAKRVWIEDESRLIGRCVLPESLYSAMQSAPSFVLCVPKEERVKRLMRTYGVLPLEILLESSRRLKKQLGGERLKNIEEALITDRKEAVSLLLQYYDKQYQKALDQRSSHKNVEVEDGNSKSMAQHLLNIS